jgi:hypothetical protein
MQVGGVDKMPSSCYARIYRRLLLLKLHPSSSLPRSHHNPHATTVGYPISSIGSYLFTCRSTGSTDIRLYANHYQFPVALHQFLVRVQAEFWTCRVIFVDTHSVNLSKDVEELLALFQVQLIPISAGTPQELGFAETRVKMIRRV